MAGVTIKCAVLTGSHCHISMFPSVLVLVLSLILLLIFIDSQVLMCAVSLKYVRVTSLDFKVGIINWKVLL